jgi:hypothetical protein
MDPFTLAAIGAVGGAMMNKDDPLKGALIGGTLGFGGGTALGAMGVGGAAAGTAAGTTVGAGGIGGAAGGTGLTAATLGGSAPVGAGLGIGSGGAAGITAGSMPAAAGMGGTGLLGTAGTGASAASPFAMAATPTALSAPFSLSGSQVGQLNTANNLMGRGQQQQQQMPPPQVAVSRRQPSQYPTLEEMYKMQVAQAAPRFSLI